MFRICNTLGNSLTLSFDSFSSVDGTDIDSECDLIITLPVKYPINIPCSTSGVLNGSPFSTHAPTKEISPCPIRTGDALA